MSVLQVHGIPDPRPEPSVLRRGLPPGALATKHEILVQGARAGGPSLPLDGVQPGDVLELEFDDGLRLWGRVEDLARDFEMPRSRAAAADVIEVPAHWTLGPRDRARGAGWALKGLKVLGVDVGQPIAAFVADHVEGKLQPGQGLYRCASEQAAALAPVRSLAGSGPVLVFLHGTASSTAGSFGDLWTGGERAPIRALLKHYGGRVLAFQHRTLTESPVENAVALVRELSALLDKGAELHLVSHSRGGLVGELVARGMRIGAAPFTRDDLALFEGKERARDRKALSELNALLHSTRFAVTRFVRVACPARGTTLADRRLDRYFSVLVNAVSLVGGAGANPVFDALTALLGAVLEQRTRPEELPGLEAMMPGSPLVQALNTPGVETAADLHVLGGDLAGAGVWGRLKTLATDFYYRDDHDLVVNTPAMLGGTPRKDPIRYWIDTGGEVTHFNYFSRADTSSRLVAALTGSGDGYHVLEKPPFAVTSSDYRKRAPVPMPVVFVLPGIMGSALSQANRPVWVELLALARGGLGSLAIDAANVSATGVIGSAYAELCAYLSATHEVVPFPYDWRLSLEEAGDALRRAVEQRLPEAERNDQPIRLLAHSMGGLVIRAMLATQAGQGTWARVCRHQGARAVMLGTPNAGAHAIAAMLIGRDATVRKLALLDLAHDAPGLLGIIARFPGVLDLLPDPSSGGLDFLQPNTWETLYTHDVPGDRGLFSSDVATSESAGFAWTRPSAADLSRARRARELLRATRLDPTRVLYVAGVADQTACDIVVDERAAEGRRVRVMASAHGDGRVLWKTGIPEGLRTFYMNAVHGDLANTREHFPALLDLLTTGTTSKLATSPPRRRAAADDVFELHEPMPAMIPDEDEIVASALGGSRAAAHAEQAPATVRVRVVHDNLTNATAPVLVGHYQQDVIVAAEGYLDRQLSGRLSELQRMELYPGPPNTVVVVTNEQDAGDRRLHPGAIVAGLGMVGELSPGRLTATLTRALTTYGAECVGRERRARQRSNAATGGTISIPLNAVLVGSGDGGLTLAGSLQSLLRAVAQANARLAPDEPEDAADGRQATGSLEARRAAGSLEARIDRVDILELYQDRAIEAVYALRALSQSPDLADFVIEDLLVVGAEGQRRARFDIAGDWWQRMRVTTDADGGFRFEALTQLARAQAALRPTQRHLVERFVSRATRGVGSDPDLGHTLFELLVPNDFKASAPEQRKLVLILDEASAALPWELLHDRDDPGERPLSVNSGLVRQLLVTVARERVARAERNTALVVGDPVVNDPRFPALPGAAEEASSVAAQLAGRGYEVTQLIGRSATPTSVLTALHESPWRILHLAAHGVFEFVPSEGARPVSGLVLDDGVFLTAAEADQLREVPELVFINCCHLGQTAGEARESTAYYRLAANLATQFIRMGARAVIAAGWAVHDSAARTFAQEFYDAMFSGCPFGDAVIRARERTWAEFGGTNTWGAYQCYGDPSFALTRTTAAAAPEAPVAAVEVNLMAERIARQAREAEPQRCAELVSILNAALSQMPTAWWADPELCAAVGEAYGELGQFEKAIDSYARALTAELAKAPLRSVEQLANLKVRWAKEQLQAGRTRAVSRLLRDAERLVTQLLAIGETAERLALMGGLQKWRARAATSRAARRTALERMQKAFERSYAVATREGRDPGAYPLANALAAQIVLGWRGAAGRTRGARAGDEIATRLESFRRAAEDLQQRSTNFFDLTAAADHVLLAALTKRTLDERTRAEVQAAYERAAQRGATPRQRASVADQLAFFEAMAETELSDADRRRLLPNLRALRAAVTPGAATPVA